jgi:hypothetical protein
LLHSFVVGKRRSCGSILTHTEREDRFGEFKFCRLRLCPHDSRSRDSYLVVVERKPNATHRFDFDDESPSPIRHPKTLSSVSYRHQSQATAAGGRRGEANRAIDILADDADTTFRRSLVVRDTAVVGSLGGCQPSRGDGISQSTALAARVLCHFLLAHVLKKSDRHLDGWTLTQCGWTNSSRSTATSTAAENGEATIKST